MMLPIPVPLITKMNPKTACLISRKATSIPGLRDIKPEVFRNLNDVTGKIFDLVVLSEPVMSSDIGQVLALTEPITTDTGTVAVDIDYADGDAHAYEDLPSVLGSRFPNHVFRIVGTGPDCRTRPALALVRRRQPTVMLFIGPSMQGKTSVASLLGRFMPVVHGDGHLMQLTQNIIRADPCLHKLLNANAKTGDWSTVIKAIFRGELSRNLIESIPDVQAKRDFVFDMWVPDSFHELVAQQFEDLGFRAFLCGRTAYPPTFPEQAYLRKNPDVAKAVSRGHFSSGWKHYEKHGRAEGRRLS